MRQSTRHHKEAGNMPRSRYISVSAATATHEALSTPTDVPTVIQEKEPTAAIILITVDATTAARTEA